MDRGFLAGGGLLLVHDPALMSLVDSWVAEIPDASFTEILPLLRRTFGSFAAPERRAIGERVAGAGPATDVTAAGPFDHGRAAAVLPTLGVLLGREIK